MRMSSNFSIYVQNSGISSVWKTKTLNSTRRDSIPDMGMLNHKKKMLRSSLLIQLGELRDLLNECTYWLYIVVCKFLGSQTRYQDVLMRILARIQKKVQNISYSKYHNKDSIYMWQPPEPTEFLSCDAWTNTTFRGTNLLRLFVLHPHIYSFLR